MKDFNVPYFFPIFADWSDLGEAMNRLESLKPHLENSSMGEEFRLFEKSLESFDTDDAVQSLQKIAEELNVSLEEDG